MQVYQIRLKLYMLRDIKVEDILSKIAHYIDSTLMQEPEFQALHMGKGYKNYCFDMPWPLEQDKTYRTGKIYTLTIRTVDCKLGKFFSEKLHNAYTDDVKGLTAEIKMIPRRQIEKVYSLTPVIMKSDEGYWRPNMSIADFEKRLKVNLLKKYAQLNGEKPEEDFELFSLMEFSNQNPIACKYKQIKLLGDKLTLYIAENAVAQKLIYMALGTGIGENNSRGYGMLNYKWL